MLASWLKSVTLGILVLLSPFAYAGDSASRVPKPVIQQAKGDKCVEDTDYMRRNHMKVLNHHRDKTVYEGVRTKQHSLKNCINCHATPDASGKETVLGKDHFCQSCHSYAAVSIDCFQCHSSKPAASAPAQPYLSVKAVGRTQSAIAHQQAGSSKANLVNSTLTVRGFAGVIK